MRKVLITVLMMMALVTISAAGEERGAFGSYSRLVPLPIGMRNAPSSFDWLLETIRLPVTNEPP